MSAFIFDDLLKRRNDNIAIIWKTVHINSLDQHLKEARLSYLDKATSLLIETIGDLKSQNESLALEVSGLKQYCDDLNSRLKKIEPS